MSWIRPFVRQIAASLEHEPELWVEGYHTLDNRKTGIELWICNIQPFDLGVWRPCQVKLNLVEKFWLHKRIKRRHEKMIEHLSAPASATRIEKNVTPIT